MTLSVLVAVLVRQYRTSPELRPPREYSVLTGSVFEEDILLTQNRGLQQLIRDANRAYRQFGGEEKRRTETLGVE
jgi:hypothetical protein